MFQSKGVKPLQTIEQHKCFDIVLHIFCDQIDQITGMSQCLFSHYCRVHDIHLPSMQHPQRFPQSQHSSGAILWLE